MTIHRGWKTIAGNVATQKNANLLTTARLFALLNFAVANPYNARRH